MTKTALITGAAKRIGKAMSIHLAKNGWNIALHYNTSEKEVNQFCDELAESYPRQKFLTFRANLENAEEVEYLIPEVLKKLGKIDLLINNASVFEPAKLKETSTDFLDRQMNVNFKAPFILTRNLCQSCQSAIIVNFVDTRIVNNKPNFAAYSLSKKVLWEFTKMAALEYGPNFRVNAIAPGLTLPPEEKGEDYLWSLAETIAMKRPGGLEPILKSLDYIIDNNYLTGQLLFCDGGENLGSTN